MTNVQTILRSLITYAICVPLAIYLGFLITDPLETGTFAAVGILLLLMSAPILLRFHHALVVLAWNMSAVIFFIPGRPHLWLLAVALSLFVSITHRTLNHHLRFLSVPQLTWPLVAMTVVVLGTAKLTGGIGMHSLGSDVFGGRRYFYLLGAILGYFALTTQRIPRERANLYIAFFFLGGLTNFIGDLFAYTPGPLKYVYLVFPPNSMLAMNMEALTSGSLRMAGLCAAGSALFCYMLAKYGIRGIFDAQKPSRAVAFVFFSLLGFFGGFRSMLIGFILIFTFQFFMEGLHRTRLLPRLGFAVVLAATLILPFSGKLPLTFQRCLTFLPVQLDPIVRADAVGSSEWRIAMWMAVLPEVPQYAFLGKGYGMASKEFNFINPSVASAFAEQWGAALAGDYHNGPLSVLIPFGIWGAGAFLWFLAAGLSVLLNNYRYGDPELRNVNTFLLATYITQMVMFFFVVGGFSNDMARFAGWLGLSVSLNGGVARPFPAVAPKVEAKTRRFTGLLPPPRPAFER